MRGEVEMSPHSVPAESHRHSMMPHPCAGWERTATSWNLIWCYENCFKETYIELRKAFGRCVKDKGGGFKCFRKARQFVEWSRSVRAKKPYVLFTDWREVKQCVAAMTLQASTSRALSTVVFCMDTRQQRRAQLWADSLTELGPIHLFQGFPSVELDIQHLLTQAFQVSDGHGGQTGNFDRGAQVAETRAISMSHLPKPARDELEAADASEQKLPQLELTQLNGGVQALCMFQHTKVTDDGVQEHGFSQLELLKKDDEKRLQMLQSHNENRSTASFVVGQAAPSTVTFPSSVGPQVAKIWTLLKCPMQVERALLAAMPDHYED